MRTIGRGVGRYRRKLRRGIRGGRGSVRRVKGAFKSLMRGRVKRRGGKGRQLLKSVIMDGPRTLAKALIANSPVASIAGCVAGVDPTRVVDEGFGVVKEAMKNVVSPMTGKRATKMAGCIAGEILTAPLKIVGAVISVVMNIPAVKKVVKHVAKVAVKCVKAVGKFLGGIFGSGRRRRRRTPPRRRRRRRFWR